MRSCGNEKTLFCSTTHSCKTSAGYSFSAQLSQSHTFSTFGQHNLLSVPRVRTTFASRGFSIADPQFGTHYPLVPVVLPLQTLSVASLKLTASSRPTAPPSGSAKCLRFGHWLTLCTLNMHILTYLLLLIVYLFDKSVVQPMWCSLLA